MPVCSILLKKTNKVKLGLKTGSFLFSMKVPIEYILKNDKLQCTEVKTKQAAVSEWP